MCNKKVCPICKGKGKMDVTPHSEGFKIVKTGDAGEERVVDGVVYKSVGWGLHTEYEQCWACKGSGEVLEGEEICPECEGRGRVTPGIFVFDGTGREGIDCPECNGRGVK